MIYIVGDTHGDQRFFQQERFLPDGDLTAGDYLIICGDFGYIYNNNTTEMYYLDCLEVLPYTVLFVDGNHENFPAIYDYPIVEWHGGKAHRIRKNILHLMRGEVFDIDGKTFFAMGGAYSIDRGLRTEGQSWWPQELPQDEEYRNAEANLEKHGFKVDYILTHTLPRSAVVHVCAEPSNEEERLASFLEWVMQHTEYRHWYCGHWHRDMELPEEKITILKRSIVEPA